MKADDFLLGTCDIRWSYMLAVIGCCDCFLLGMLALSLGYKQRIIDHEASDASMELGPPHGYLINNMEMSSEMKNNNNIGKER